MNADSTQRPSPRKPSPDPDRRVAEAKATAKLRNPEFPLSIHKGQERWCKKVRRVVHYFGKIADDPQGIAAEELWLEQKDDLIAGRVPRAKADTEALRVGDLCNEFLDHKERLRDNGELSPRTFRGYYDTCAEVVEVLGRNRAVADLTPNDFGKVRAALAKTRGPVALGNEIQRVRSLFKFAFDQGLIVAPVRFGQSFAKPKMDVVRRAREAHRAKHGDRMFEAAEIRQLLDGTTVQGEDGKSRTIPGASLALRAMILLAANGGLGQSDLAALPIRAVDLDEGWVDFARVKTAIPRRIPLWPETVEAIRQWLPRRPTAKDEADAGLLFLTRCGTPWVKISAEKGSPCDSVGLEFGKLVRSMGLKRPRVAFYALRHGFETVAGETADQVAVDAIMGHVPQGMAGVYRERIGADRLRRVAEHVRAWLFPKPPEETPADKPAKPRRQRNPRAQRPQPVESLNARPVLRIVG
jgi:integrase